MSSLDKQTPPFPPSSIEFEPGNELSIRADSQNLTTNAMQNPTKHYFLRVLDTLARYSDIVSDISSGSIYGIYIYIYIYYIYSYSDILSDILSRIYSDILSGIVSGI